MADSLLGKLCLLGFVAPILAGFIRYQISQSHGQDFYILTGYMPWELKLYFLSLIWFVVAICRMSFTRRCPKCRSANNVKLRKREVGQHEGTLTETIEVGENVITGLPKYESYNVPTTFSKVKYSYKCQHCYHQWDVIREIPVSEPSLLKSIFAKYFTK